MPDFLGKIIGISPPVTSFCLLEKIFFKFSEKMSNLLFNEIDFKTFLKCFSMNSAVKYFRSFFPMNSAVNNLEFFFNSLKLTIKNFRNF